MSGESPTAQIPVASAQADAVIVGAGFSGLYMLLKLRELGLTVTLLEAGPEVGGTWYWNRYPGARCDIESIDYSYSFSEELQQEWEWTERYAGQPEILKYLKHVADRFDLRPHIEFNTRVVAAHYDSAGQRWNVRREDGSSITSRFVVMATGCLSVPQTPQLPGLDAFSGEVFHTAEWPEEGVDVRGKRVAVLGTGSSAIQAIPILARQAEHLTVLQRTPNFTIPARNGPLDAEFLRAVKENYPARRVETRRTFIGLIRGENLTPTFAVSPAVREREYERRWAKGGVSLVASFVDLMVDQSANDKVADFVRAKIREVVRDPEAAESLSPYGYPFGAKRVCLDTDYYTTFNRDDVTLVDLKKTPLQTFTETGVQTAGAAHDFDILVMATGFDAMTGAIARIDIRGREGRELQDKWRDGPRAYLGLGTAGFPNMFFITGPGSPSVLTNMAVAIEQHVEWTADCIGHMEARGFHTIEASASAEDAWVAHVNEVANYTLFPKAASWYTGANIPGKPRLFMPYVGGMYEYSKRCHAVAAEGYEGFVLK